ncbi:amidase family protein [Aurantimicrobium minutum]|uniref:amidase family protein n=1 Tax=Aurantimicrobium minutum TaxID=708131 RepID=UPI002475A4FA|nr:amidase family protein [Aurantimicrobium minutum]MDH6536109.1 Asp-tRNA(Asn)/Glu-tRNA(Gln) amidotransferase A subunit family amidase [Aurantimicrobium minutum]
MFIDLYASDAVLLPEQHERTTSPLSSLNGVRYGVKNNIAVQGHAMQAGSPALPDTPTSTSAEVVQRLTKAGAECMGSLNMHELALGTTSNNAFFGPTPNPRDLTRTAGGSSGGSAAAVADGSVAFALGTDTGGSCRIPAAYCGVTGFRPTTGRYPRTGVFMISPTRDTVGILANFVSDIALVDEAITGDADFPSCETTYIRIGLPRHGFFTESSPEVATVVEFAIERLEEEGIEFVDVELAGSHDIALAGLHVVAFEAPREVLSFFGFTPTTDPFTETELRLLHMFVEDIASPDVKSIFGHFVDSPISEKQYLAALTQREELQESYDKVFAENKIDALVYPTVGIVAPLIGQDTVSVHGVERPLFPYSISNTDSGSLAGQPSLSLPIPRMAGALPVGLGVEGARGDDRRLLALSAVLEEILTRN